MGFDSVQQADALTPGQLIITDVFQFLIALNSYANYNFNFRADQSLI